MAIDPITLTVIQAGLGQVGHQLRDPAGVGRGGRGAIHRLFEPRGGDQFHRSRNLLDIANRRAAFIEGSCFGHGILLL